MSTDKEPAKGSKSSHNGDNGGPDKGKGKARASSYESTQAYSTSPTDDADYEDDDPRASQIGRFARTRSTTPGRSPSGTYACPQCSRTYARADGLNRHVKNVHDTAQRKFYQCPHCPHSSVRSDNLAKHIRNKHGVGSERITCQLDDCDVGVLRADKYLVHVADVHADDIGEILYETGKKAYYGRREDKDETEDEGYGEESDESEDEYADEDEYDVDYE
ncbi:uncharacterized protein N0V89_003679 [Didymosphaeria variabile]|uniref:C2H2-type domain-containing protein n=1 Tax=Didymosphaeria variabile TaxID=1932322 RepID=A0A9W9CBR1_9PLEO|nr:uncharacterized protein N0V89_003679 [Didymosphaeria variabile]KAJ4355659.1 hypothetical protein N0V89_003679 [Didymosphaeria variabile]